ncbi:hypothetical protein CASFOL_024529 [Castilleja foliolosa]|uniref:Uncharacterized protein n=1 Tax=Castilleja foliolosa TaxID=1961234 RepID=A0ABD3CNK4_9LAMI
MEDKKLDFNQPFLSVRRNLPTTVTTSRISKEERKTRNPRHHLPPHRSDVKSGPIRSQGAVPFLWEHTPGQPKYKDTTKQPTDKNTKLLTNTPHVTAPKLPPGRLAVVVDINIENATKVESSDSVDTDEAYVDALDTLSRTESFSQNCSTSGLSGPGNYLFTKTPSMDREFMMDRFLPAAKAMASETTTKYVNKKQQLVVEERVKNQGKPELRYGPSFAKRYSDYLENEDDSDDDDEYDESRNLPGVCGLLPRFCFSLMNPVPAMSMRTRVNNVQPRSSSDGSLSKIENEPRSVGRTELKFEDKFQTDKLDDDDKTKGFGSDAKGLKSFEELLGGQGEVSSKESNSSSPVVEKTLYEDTTHKANSSQELDDFSIFCSIDKSTEKHGTDEKKATESVLVNYSRHPVPPPLPKSPSDSWLGRTLPSMSNKNPSLRLYPGPRNELPKAPTSGDIKWETMVKTTKVQRRHMHYSEESLIAIPET